MDRIILGLVVVVGVPAATVGYVWAFEWVLGRMSYTAAAKIRPWLWLLPAFVLLAFYLIYPGLNTIRISFMDARSTEYVGMDNYQFAFTDPAMLTAFKNNLLWLVFFTGGTVILGLVVAVLSDRVRYETLVKAIIFLPMAISYVAAGVIWKLVYDFQPAGQPQTGVINALLVSIFPNFEPKAWLFNTSFNNPALIFVGVWMWTGFCMVVLSGALKGIPQELLEAARVDGATEWQVFRGVILPLMASTIVVVTTTMVINVLKIFDIVYVMTNGLLGTEVVANRMYKEMFNFRHYGRASALAVVLLLATLPVMIVNVRRFQRQEEIR
ncbi:MAG: sugar ABC transporter permease [Anaerolineae bacterium]|jgi:alpha-glucoside transport system permease protein|nr:sugar ABC transporter permease [Anaerolineae bacterium]